MALNYIQPGDTLPLTWATTSPVSGAPVVKSGGAGVGGIVGVALNGVGTAGEVVDVALRGVFRLSVTTGTVALGVGDSVFATVPATREVSTTTLNNTATGNLLFGRALAPIAASTTAVIEVALER